MTLVVRNIAIHSVALRFSPLGCGAAHVHHSASLHVVYSGTLCSSFLPVAFYAQRRLQYSDSVSPSSTHAARFWMKAGLFCLCSDGETALVPSRWSYVEEDALLFAPSCFPLIFQQNVGRAFCARLPRSALFGRGCLTEEGVPGSLFHPIYSLRNKRSLYAKGGLSRQGERDCFSVTFPKIWIPLGTESERDSLCCQSYLYRLMYRKRGAGLRRPYGA